jgi:hypothetical protein
MHHGLLFTAAILIEIGGEYPIIGRSGSFVLYFAFLPVFTRRDI